MTEKLTPKKADEWRPIFLKVLRNSGNVRAACAAAHITRQAAYKARDASKEFAADWADALDDAIDGLEAVAIDRARRSSDTLLIFLLKAHRPEKYRETTRTININVDPEQLKDMTDAELDQVAEQLDQAARRS